MVGATDRVHICLRSSTMVEEYIWYNRIRAQWQIPETRRDRQWCRLVAPIKPVFHSLQNITATTTIESQRLQYRWPDLASDCRAGSAVRVGRRRRRDHRWPAVLAAWGGKRTLVMQSPHGTTHDQLLLQRCCRVSPGGTRVR